jgi:hypothetical protein
VAPGATIDRASVTEKAGIVALAGSDVLTRTADLESRELASVIVSVRNAATAYGVYGLAVKDWVDAGAAASDLDRKEVMYRAGIAAADALGDVRSKVALADASGDLDCKLG